MSQLSIPIEISPQEVARESSLGGSISLCAKAAGIEPKQIQDILKTDKAQWSRWESGAEGVIWPKLRALMDACGNDAPLLWMLHQRGYELGSLRKRESETERDLREALETIDKLRHEREVERRLFRDLRLS
jgi:hypothetical protein